MTLASAPYIVLVRPQMGENIGATARAMKNFGLSELRLVSPRDGWPNDKAVATASHAKDIVRHATIYSTLPDALADCHIAYGCSARRRDSDIEHITVAEATMQTRRSQRQAAYVFGPENNGLSNDDVACCQKLLTIPTGEYSSLNLAQSVIICAYDWFSSTRIASSDEKLTPVASLHDKHALYKLLVKTLDTKGYFPPNGKERMMRATLQGLVERAPISPSQIKRLRNIIYCLSK